MASASFPVTFPSSLTLTSTQTLSDVGHADSLHNKDRAEIIATQTKLGLGSSVAGTSTVLRGTGGTTSAWGQIEINDLANPSLHTLMVRPLTINGNFDHFQRLGTSVGTQTSTSTYSKTASYAADRVYAVPGAGTVTQTRSSSVPNANSRYSLQVTGGTSVTTLDIGQRISAAQAAIRGTQSLVFSCYVYPDFAGTFTPSLRVGTPGSSDDFTSVTNRLDQSLQSCAGSAWTRVYYVFDPSAYTNIANGLDAALRIPSGTMTAGKVLRIAQFDLRPGTVLMPFVPPNPDAELRLSQRYHRTYGPGGTNVAFATGLSNATNSALYSFPVSPPMRTTPTLEVSAVGDFSGFDNGTPVALNALAIGAGSPDTLQLSATQAGTTWTQWRPNLLLGSTSAVLALNAEL